MAHEDDELHTVRVPTALAATFRSAEQLVSSYFGKRRDDPTRGTIEIAGQRYLLVRAASLSVEFFELVEQLYGPGREQEAREFARNILFDLAHAIGKSDAANFHRVMGIDDPLARLAAGPVHFAHCGWAFVDVHGGSRPLPTKDYVLFYDHPYAFESDAWVKAGRRADFPVCIMNAGYSSGWCEQSFGMPLVASEVLCRARGDSCCRFIMAPPDQLESHVKRYMADQPALAARIRGYEIPDFFSRKKAEEDLRNAHDEMEERVRQRTAELEAANDRLRQEIAERDRIQTQLQKSQRVEALGRLAGGVAHDFNNLLGVIMGYSSLLQGRVPKDDPTYPMLNEITEAARLAANLTRQLLTFSRSQVFVKRKIDLNELVAEATSMLRRLVGDGIRLTHNLVEAGTLIEADPTYLEQLLVNLVANARDAMPQGGGRIDITTSLVASEESGWAGQVKLTVEDDGEGMDQETLKRIFEPFFTTHAERGRSGLGLSTVYGIVTESSGTIQVDSTLGGGTRFEMIFPLVERQTGGPLNPTPRPQRGETVLLAEDGIGLRALIADLLDEAGYEVLVAHDSEDALRIAQQHPGEIDVLVTDVVMPGMDGRELARRVLEDRPGVRVLMMSGYAQESVELEQLEGQDAVLGFIGKPFTPADLGRALRELLER